MSLLFKKKGIAYMYTEDEVIDILTEFANEFADDSIIVANNRNLDVNYANGKHDAYTECCNYILNYIYQTWMVENAES